MQSESLPKFSSGTPCGTSARNAARRGEIPALGVSVRHRVDGVEPVRCAISTAASRPFEADCQHCGSRQGTAGALPLFLKILPSREGETPAVQRNESAYRRCLRPARRGGGPGRIGKRSLLSGRKESPSSNSCGVQPPLVPGSGERKKTLRAEARRVCVCFGQNGQTAAGAAASETVLISSAPSALKISLARSSWSSSSAWTETR